MQQRALGPFQVSAIGLGCMNLSHAYGAPVSPEQGERVLLAALDAGVTLFDTAALYGFGANETLVGRVLKNHRSRFTLASKCGMQGVDVNGDGKLVRVIDGRPATLRQTCEDSLRRLQTDVIDLYYLHRWDKTVPIEDSVGALADLVRAGKIRSIGLWKCRRPRCAGRTPYTPSLPCRPNTRCGRATRKLPCWMPAANWAWPLSPSAPWAVAFCAAS